MKIVIMADSLAMPRAGETNIAFEGTYPYLLEQSLRSRPETQSSMVIERGMRRRTIEYVLDEWAELVELRRPDVLVIHVGIVDCAPRVFLRRERQFVENIRPAALRNAILKFVHNHRPAIVKFRKKVYVPPRRFQALLTEVLRRTKASGLRSLVLVNIVTPPPEMDERSPGFIENVRTYNQILKTQAQGEGIHLIDLNRIIDVEGGPGKLTVDGIHINEEGHRILAAEIEKHVLTLVEEARTDIEARRTFGGFN
jgi:acyl-CoA thioesterase I